MSRLVVKFSVFVSLITISIIGCKTIDQNMADRGGAGDSILASVEGITPADKKNMAAVKYWLECRGISANPIRIVGKFKTVAGKDELSFDGKKIKDGLKCTLEIRGEKEPKDLNVKWHTQPVEPGLYFASSWATVKKRKLSLKVYKLFSVIPDVPTFTAWVHVQAGEITEGQSADRNQPGLTNVTAELFCGGKKLPEIGTYSKEETKGERIKFVLEVAKMSAIDSCERLEIFDNESKKAFEVDLGELPIKGTSKEVKDFKTAEFNGYPMYWLPADLSVDACVHKLNDRNCEITLPDENSFWLAKIVMVKGDGDDKQQQDVIVSNKNFKSDSKKVINIFEIRDGLIQGSMIAFRDEFLDKIKGENEIPFDEAFLNLSADAVASSLVDVESELDGFKITNIESLYLHQFAAVEENQINKLATAVWYADISFSKDAQTYNAIVTGKDPVFRSIEAPADNGFLEFDGLAADILEASENRWFMFHFTGEAFSPSECEIAIGDAKTDLNARDLSNIANAQKVAACKIDMTTLSGLTNFTTPAYYLWGWHIAEIL
jgi:hypothetical protein